MNLTSKPANPPVEILVAEDSPTQAQRLQHVLQQHGYHVTAAVNELLADHKGHQQPQIARLSVAHRVVIGGLGRFEGALVGSHEVGLRPDLQWRLSQ